LSEIWYKPKYSPSFPCGMSRLNSDRLKGSTG
jgi:hypothetical protein